LSLYTLFSASGQKQNYLLRGIYYFRAPVVLLFALIGLLIALANKAAHNQVLQNGYESIDTPRTLTDKLTVNSFTKRLKPSKVLYGFHNLVGGVLIITSITSVGLAAFFDMHLPSIPGSLSLPISIYVAEFLLDVFIVLSMLKVCTLPRNPINYLADVGLLIAEHEQSSTQANNGKEEARFNTGMKEKHKHSWQTPNYLCGCIADGYDRFDVTNKRMMGTSRSASCLGQEQWHVTTWFKQTPSFKISEQAYSFSPLHPPCCSGVGITFTSIPGFFPPFIMIPERCQAIVRNLTVQLQTQWMEKVSESNSDELEPKSD